MRLVAATIVSLLGMSAAIADQKQAQSCVAQLSTESKLIFEQSAPDVTGGADIKSTLESKTRALVMAGKVARSDARPSAEAAGNCLKLLKS